MGEVLQALGIGLVNYFTPVQGQLLETFAVTPKNFECLKKVALLIEILGKRDEAIR